MPARSAWHKQHQRASGIVVESQVFLPHQQKWVCRTGKRSRTSSPDASTSNNRRQAPKAQKYPTPLPIRLIRERPALDRHRFRTPVVQLDPIVKFGVSRYAGIRDPAGRLGLADEILPDIVRRDQDLRVFGDGLQRAKELESRVVGQPAIMRLDGEHIVAGANQSRAAPPHPFRASPKPRVKV